MSYYTIQKCSICGKKIEIDAEDFLMNLEIPIKCTDCFVKDRGGDSLSSLPDFDKLMES